ncbi:MAG: hypothetical protein QOJ24_3576 [Mycobacterium sp.]|nr:hypothetical protein [Mycobacterium sp.]
MAAEIGDVAQQRDAGALRDDRREGGVEGRQQRSADRPRGCRVADDHQEQGQQHRGRGSECRSHSRDGSADGHRIDPQRPENGHRVAGQSAEHRVDVDGHHTGQQGRVARQRQRAHQEGGRLAHFAHDVAKGGGAQRRSNGDEDDGIELHGARRIFCRRRCDVLNGGGEPASRRNLAAYGFGRGGNASATSARDVDGHLAGWCDHEGGVGRPFADLLARCGIIANHIDRQYILATNRFDDLFWGGHRDGEVVQGGPGEGAGVAGDHRDDEQRQRRHREHHVADAGLGHRRFGGSVSCHVKSLRAELV